MEWEVCVASDTGLVRHRNEDIAAVGHKLYRDEQDAFTRSFPEPPAAFVAGVADGVGGGAAGDVASKLTLERFMAGLQSLDGGLPDDKLRKELSALVSDLHEEVIRQGMLHSDRAGMATTLSAFVWYGGVVYMAHAGDSRLYLHRGGALSRLTRDHTLREFTGNMNIPGNILVNCIGVEKEFFVDVACLENVGSPGDILLACTDGLTDTVSEREISDTLSGAERMEAAGTELLSRAKVAGAHDNVTFVLIRVS
jgi:protein phosphatase